MKKQKRNKNRPALTVEFDREEDGRWIAEVPELPGVLAYGTTRQAALRKIYATALRTLADKVEHGRTPMPIFRLFDYAVARR